MRPVSNAKGLAARHHQLHQGIWLAPSLPHSYLVTLPNESPSVNPSEIPAIPLADAPQPPLGFDDAAPVQNLEREVVLGVEDRKTFTSDGSAATCERGLLDLAVLNEGERGEVVDQDELVDECSQFAWQLVEETSAGLVVGGGFAARRLGHGS